MLENIMGRLNRLTPQELQLLDAAITPEVGAVVVKAFPELSPLIRPLMQPDGMAPQQGAPQPMQAPLAGGGALGGMTGGGY